MKKKIMAMMLATACIGASTLYFATSVNAAEQDTAFIMGDVNGDGSFGVSAVVLLQKWLVAIPDATLTDWQAGDMAADSIIDSFDFCIMKRELLYRN